MIYYYIALDTPHNLRDKVYAFTIMPMRVIFFFEMRLYVKNNDMRV